MILVAIPNLFVFYFVFTPLTVYPAYYALSLFFNVTLNNTSIFLGSLEIQIVAACVAGSAYYLMLILNLSVPNIDIKKRIKMISFSFLVLLMANILRIVILAIMAYTGSIYFDVAHKIFWYFLSTIFVVSIWFLEVYMFKIKGLPFIDDLKLLYSKSSLKKQLKKSKRAKKN